jgi:hypothetical protein
VYRLLTAGHSLATIAAELGLSRNTVRRFAHAADLGELLVRDWTPRTVDILHDFMPYLREPWNSSCVNATVLWQEIRERLPGGYSIVRDYLAHFRGNARVHAPARKPPKPRSVTTWIMNRPADLDPGDQASLDAITASSAELATHHARTGPSPS